MLSERSRTLVEAALFAFLFVLVIIVWLQFGAAYGLAGILAIVFLQRRRFAALLELAWIASVVAVYVTGWAVVNGIYSVWTRLSHALFDQWYGYVTKVATAVDPPLLFLNYGYASADNEQEQMIALDDQDEPNRYSIQLYHHLAGSIPVQGRDVLEVSCGHGGGAGYVMRYLKPKSYHAIDRNKNAISFCQRHYSLGNLTFARCSAERIDCGDARFDIAINVEASHAYQDPAAFLREVARVLRFNGHLLLVDIQSHSEIEFFERYVREAGLQMERRENITPHVIRGLRLITKQRLETINNIIGTLPQPASLLAKHLLRRFAKGWAAVEGSRIFNDLESGKLFYMSYMIRNIDPDQGTLKWGADRRSTGDTRKEDVPLAVKS